MTGFILALIICAIGLVVLVVALVQSDKKKAKEKAEQEAHRLELERYKEEVQQKRKDRILKRYGDEIGYKILKEQYFIGMTKEQVLDAKGSRGPDKKEKEELKTKVKETWIYGNKSSGDVFVFENEVLTKYKDR